MAAFVGSIKEYSVNGRESFESYEERIDFFFKANSIVDADKQKAVFFTVCGEELYQLIRNLVAPGKTVDKTFKEVIDLVREHLNPKPNVIIERYKFNSRVRKAGESISDFVADLRNLCRFCEYNAVVDEMIRDRLVCGINDVAIQRKLLSEAGLDLKKAIKIAHGMEIAAKESAAISGSREIHGLDHRGKKVSCFRCGYGRHKAPFSR